MVAVEQDHKHNETGTYMALKNAMDLTKNPPRSIRVRLGGYVLLPRMLDKCRATIAGTNGEYNYACPMDEYFFNFTGVDPEKLKKQVASGKGDGDLLLWIQKNSKTPRTEFEIAGWSAWLEQRAPSVVESREFYHGAHAKIAPKREDISTWFDLLDLDDYSSFGGQV